MVWVPRGLILYIMTTSSWTGSTECISDSHSVWLPASYLLTSNMSTEIHCKKFKGTGGEVILWVFIVLMWQWILLGCDISEVCWTVLILWVFIVLMWQWILLGCGACGHNVFIVCCGFLLPGFSVQVDVWSYLLTPLTTTSKNHKIYCGHSYWRIVSVYWLPSIVYHILF